MSEEGLYQDRVKELARTGGAGRDLSPYDAEATVRNPMCGDQVTVRMRRNDSGVIVVGYEARGCLVSLASCARLGELVDASGSEDELVEKIEGVLGMFDGETPGYMEEFAPVKNHRSRHECVFLPYKALSGLLSDG